MVMKQPFQRITFTEDFEGVMKKFLVMIEKDKRIVQSSKDPHKKKSYFSHAVRVLIADYVNKNWSVFEDKYKPKNEDEIS